MERLTGKHYHSDDYYMACSGTGCHDEDHCEDCNELSKIVNTLGAIEDILGDDYDLDQLRGLMTAEREGRLFILQIKPGDSVYWLLEDDDWYISDPEIVADVGTKGFYLSGVRDSVEPGDNPSFVPWAEIGKTVFLSREEAEAALAKMKEG